MSVEQISYIVFIVALVGSLVLDLFVLNPKGKAVAFKSALYQYGVGDKVDVLEVQGVVETVGLRITTVRDSKGTVWYLRNGEILKVGNKSQPKNGSKG